MSSRRTTPQSLTDVEIQRITEELAGGSQPTVWFTSAAVGVAEGKSGKILALGNPAEGDFLQVRPTGSKDVMSFSPTEVTLTKPAVKKAAMPEKPTAPEKPTVPAQPAAVHPARPAAPAAAAQPVQPAAPAQPRPARPAAARKSKPAVEVVFTVTGTADGEWTVDVDHGKKRVVRALPVSGVAVSQAAKALAPEVSEAIESVLQAARDTQRAKVEQLQAELEQAQRLLAELSED